MADVKNNLGNIAAMAERPQAPTNRPAQYNDRRNPYFGDPTARFVQTATPTTSSSVANSWYALPMRGRRATP